jgi:hypothetical protein
MNKKKETDAESEKAKVLVASFEDDPYQQSEHYTDPDFSKLPNNFEE